MAESAVDNLNAILADQWSLVRLLRKLEGMVEHPGTREALKRVRFDLSAHCATLSCAVRELGGGPVDEPGAVARKVEETNSEEELWLMLTAELGKLCLRIRILVNSLEASPLREALAAVERSHRENRQWLGRITPAR